MSKGGGTQKTVSEPWTQAQPYLKESFGLAQQAVRNPPQFYPGQTFVGPTGGEMDAWANRLGYADSVFGGQPTLQYGQATDALGGLLGGGALGSMAGQVAAPALEQLRGWNPYGQAGGLDATGAIQSMLSGQPDYSGLQGAIDAANAPLLRQLNEQIIPGLNQRATFLNNDSGGVKALNRVMPEIGERMSENALGLMLGERNRALSAQQGAAQMVAGGGQQANQQALGLGGLYGSLAGGASGDAIRALGLFPGVAEMGQYPGDLAAQFANWGRGFQEQQLGDQMQRWDFQQQQPMDMAQWYSSLVGGLGGLGSSGRSTTPQNYGLNALGGAMMGSQVLPALAPAIGGGMGAGIGALLALI